MTFAEIAEEFAKDRRGRVREASFENMRYNLNRYVIPVFGDLDAEEITESRILSEIWKIGGARGSVSLGTLRKNFMLVKQIARFGMDRGAVRPFLLDFKIGTPTASSGSGEGEGEASPLTESEAEKLMNAAEGNQTGANVGFLLSLCLGLRIGEACALRWSDFDMVRGFVKIERTVQRIDDGSGNSVVAELPLGHESSRREKPLSKSLSRLLSGRFGSRFEPDGIGHGFFVATDSEKCTEPRVYSRAFTRFCESSGLRPMKFSELRMFHDRRMKELISRAEMSPVMDIP